MASELQFGVCNHRGSELRRPLTAATHHMLPILSVSLMSLQNLYSTAKEERAWITLTVFVHTSRQRLLSYEREEEDQGANSLFLFTRAEKEVKSVKI